MTRGLRTMADQDFIEAKSVDVAKEDEMLPKGAQPVAPSRSDEGGERRDTAGEHGEMAPEAAKGLDLQQQEGA